MNVWTLLAVGFAVLVPASPATAAVIWRGDMETGTTKQWNYLAVPAQISVVTEPVRAGKYALRIASLKEGDRVEVQHNNSASPEGQDRFYAFSLMVPTTLQAGERQTGYFESQTSYQQIMTFVISETTIAYDSRTVGPQRRWTGRGLFTPGVWHDLIIHVKWSQNASMGFVEIWFDGVKVLDRTAMATLKDANPAFLRLGFLSGHPGETIYVDEAIEGETLADVEMARPQVGGAGGSGGTASGGAGGAGGTASGGSTGTGGRGGSPATGGRAGGGGESAGGEGGSPDPEPMAGGAGGGGHGGDADNDEPGTVTSGCTIGARGEGPDHGASRFLALMAGALLTWTTRCRSRPNSSPSGSTSAVPLVQHEQTVLKPG